MLRTAIITAILLNVFIGAASADVLYTDPRPPEQSSGTWLIHGVINQSKLAAVILSERLTFLDTQRDVDKDGFVDSSIVAIANPNGYVVFHFRSIQLNRRIVLGHFLDAEGMGPLTLDTGNSGGGVAGPHSSIIFGDDLNLLNFTPNDPNFSDGPLSTPLPAVPEPATVAMLAMGSFAMLGRKRRHLRG